MTQTQRRYRVSPTVRGVVESALWVYALREPR
jgi:hypothetical protein